MTDGLEVIAPAAVAHAARTVEQRWGRVAMATGALTVLLAASMGAFGVWSVPFAIAVFGVTMRATARRRRARAIARVAGADSGEITWTLDGAVVHGHDARGARGDLVLALPAGEARGLRALPAARVRQLATSSTPPETER